jgi:hypothetical protein
MMLVNHLSTQQNVVVDNTTIKLDPYQVLVTATV